MNLKQLLEDLKLKHGDDPDENFDSKELKIGIKIEKEHTDSGEIAKRIAKAHLAEFPHYYTDTNGLLNMEKKLKKTPRGEG